MLLHISRTIIRSRAGEQTAQRSARGPTPPPAHVGNTLIKTYCRHAAALSNNKVSFSGEGPNDSREDHSGPCFCSARAGTTLLKHGETREAQYIIFIPGRARKLNLYQPDKKVTFV